MDGGNKEIYDYHLRQVDEKQHQVIKRDCRDAPFRNRDRQEIHRAEHAHKHRQLFYAAAYPFHHKLKRIQAQCDEKEIGDVKAHLAYLAAPEHIRKVMEHRGYQPQHQYMRQVPPAALKGICKLPAHKPPEKFQRKLLVSRQYRLKYLFKSRLILRKKFPESLVHISVIKVVNHLLLQFPGFFLNLLLFRSPCLHPHARQNKQKQYAGRRHACPSPIPALPSPAHDKNPSIVSKSARRIGMLSTSTASFPNISICPAIA